MTADGHTVTLVPSVNPTIIAKTRSTREPTPTEALDGTGPLPTHTEWPPEAILKPVETEVGNPETSDDNREDGEDNDGALLPGKLWFFSASGACPSDRGRTHVNTVRYASNSII